MKKIEAIVRPDKLAAIRDALARYNIKGMTLSDCLGCGRQKGYTGVSRGREFAVSLLPKVKLEVVVTDDYVEEVVDIIITHGRTGEVGDGKVFVLAVEEAYRIRTGETGKSAL